MPRTIQCQRCGVILNLPPHVPVGKRLKCPKCATRFVVSETDASSVSTAPGMSDAAPTSFDLEKLPPFVDDLPRATSEGDLRDTFDLPLISGREAEQGQAVSGTSTADAAGLFQDHGASRRRVTAAEARSRARRCTHCGSSVPQGMSICPTCGTDQETGVRVGLDDDLSPPPPPRLQGPPLHVSIVGGLCGTAAIITALASVVYSTQGASSVEHYAWLTVAAVAAFIIFGCVQFLRGKSAKVLLLGLTIGMGVDVLGLVAVPIIQPMLEDQDQMVREVKPQGLDESDIELKSFEERINTRKIQLGVLVILIYAVLSVYLTSMPVRKYVFRCRPDRTL
jgi:hypothetical protein